MDALLQQLLGPEEQLASKAHAEIRAIAALLLLRLRRHHKQLGRWMHHLQLGDDGVGVAGNEVLAEVVYDELVHAVGPQRSLRDLRQVLACLDVSEQGFVNA